jgi:hypothetical protein
MPSIERLNELLGKILFVWSISCIIAGLSLHLFSLVLLYQGIGFQFALWGFINLIISITLLRRTDHSLDKIKRELYTSLTLDAIYPIIGLILIIFFGYDAYLLGNGYGIILQGVFLTVLDLSYYRTFRQLS